MTEPALLVRNVSHSFGATRALEDVSLTVPRGGFTALLGVNGAGKTTLFNLVTRLYANRSGVIEVAGHDLRRQPTEALRRLGVVFQSRALDADLTVRQNLMYHAALHGIPRAEARPRVAEVLAQVQALYAIESQIRGHPAEHRRQARQARSRPIVEALHDWLLAHQGRVSATSDLAKAIRYALRHWLGLTLFLEDGRVEMDSNVVERAIRPVALNRKNALFAGSDGGARHWAIAMTLIQTAKLNGVEPMAWLTDVLEREGIPQNVIAAGKVLEPGLAKLAKKYPIVADVRGKGLFWGLEIVRDHATRAPAVDEADRIMNLLREDGFLLGRTGAFDNVIKVRPPLVFTPDNARMLLEGLERALDACETAANVIANIVVKNA